MLSQWLDEAALEREDEAPALNEDIRADVCIVGGGYCGLWTALALKQREPSLDIAIVEKKALRRWRKRAQWRLRAELVAQLRRAAKILFHRRRAAPGRGLGRLRQ